MFLTDPDLEFWIRVVSRYGSGSAGSVAALVVVGMMKLVQSVDDHVCGAVHSVPVRAKLTR